MKKLEMTSGSITKKILLFSLPMIIGSFFQLLYSTIDGVVIGRFCGKSALAAVGAATPIYNILMFLLIGLCNGAQILFSEFYGARRIKTLKQNLGTSLTAGSILSLVLMVVLLLGSRLILDLTQVKPELLSEATDYLFFMSLGLLPTFIYNIYAVALRATGDSVRPLFILAFSSVCNIGLDFLFVAGLGMGVKGAAIATAISQSLAALIAIIYGTKIDPIFRFSLSDLKIVWAQLKETSKYAIASALQQIVLFVGKSIVQISVNSLSIDAQAAFTAAGKIDDYVLTPLQCIGNTTAVFIAQNRGAHHKERCKKGLFTGMTMSVSYAVFIAIVIFLAREPLIRLFLRPEDDVVAVIKEGSKYYTFMCFFFLYPACTNSVQSYFRGLGKLSIVFYSTTVQIIFRASSSILLVKHFGIEGAALCTAVGWTAMLLFEVPILIYFLKTQRGLDHITKIDIVQENNATDDSNA